MPILSQLDPRWSMTRLGDSSLTVGRWGCALTSLVNLANALGANPQGLTPGDMAKDSSLFTKADHPGGAGLILWDRACRKLDRRLVFTKRQGYRDDKEILASLKDPKRGVILNVAGGAHFALAWRKSLFGNDFVIADPLGGKKVLACAKYGNIVGSRHFDMV